MGSRMLLIFAAQHWIPGSLATCYLPNGQEQPGVVCNTTAEFSACCADVDMCTNQGFCKSPVDAGDNYYWREGCTDPTWTSSACPRHCYDQSTGDTAPTRNWLMLACSQTTFCCTDTSGFADPNCCDENERVFDAGPASYAGGNTTVATLKFFETMSRTASTTSTASQTTSATFTSTPPAISQTNSATSTTSTPTSSTSASSEPSGGLSTGAKAGIGVGIASGALAFAGIGALAVILLKKRRPYQSANIEEPEKPAEYWNTSGSPAQDGKVPYEVVTHDLAEADSQAVRGYRPVELPSGEPAELSNYR